MLPSARKLIVSAIMLAVLVVQDVNSDVPCFQDALNTAVDLILYYVQQNLTNFIPIPEVDQKVAGGLVSVIANNGRCGGLRSLEREGDYYTDFIEEETANREKPSDKKVMMKMKGAFKKLWVEYNYADITLSGCQTKGILNVKVQRSVFEVQAVSSDKHRCLMDLKLLKFYSFGPIHLTIEPAQGWFCAALTQVIFNTVVNVFSVFTKMIIRQNLITAVLEHFPSDNGPLCVAPDFDVVFL